MFRTGPVARIPAESPKSVDRAPGFGRRHELKQTEFELQGQYRVVAIEARERHGACSGQPEARLVEARARGSARPYSCFRPSDVILAYPMTRGVQKLCQSPR